MLPRYGSTSRLTGTPLHSDRRPTQRVLCYEPQAAKNSADGRGARPNLHISAEVPRFSLSCPIGHRVDIWNENWTRCLRTDARCGFSNSMSMSDSLNCTNAPFLTRCPAGFVSLSCPLFRWNHPGMSGDSTSCEGWSHGRWFVEAVSAGAA